MTVRMLINAQNPEELRVAVLQGDTLESFNLETAEHDVTRGNIYRGVITSLHTGLSAAFVDYGAGRDGFLPADDVVEHAWHHTPKSKGRPHVDEILERGRPVLVQVVKEAEGTKGALLTTDVSLAGRYLVLTPFDRTRGVSRKVEDEETRRQLREQAEALEVPEGAGFIVRTNALEQTKTSLNRDFGALMRVWKKVLSDFGKGKGPAVLYGDQDLVVKVLRDSLDASIDEVLIDDDDAFARANAYVASFMPRNKKKLVRYTERIPLFSRYGVESHIERIYDRRVPLASGGSIVIDRTEALVAIDVNSGRARGGHIEQTALQTNLEAADAVASQLRLRDIGGLIVVDFIDMRSAKSRSEVERRLRESMKRDKARFSVGRISENGLLEINRQKIQQALSLRAHRPCPTCSGTGRIASPEAVGLALLRKIEARAAGGSLERVRIELHPELADAFQNARRQEIAAIEKEFGVRVEVIASSRLHRPDQEIEWFDKAQARAEASAGEGSSAREVSAEGGDGKKSKRKRRRKKHKGNDADPEAAAPASGETPAGDDDDWSDDDESPEEDGEVPGPAPVAVTATEGGEKKSKRKRRRKKKKKKGADETLALPAGGESETEDDHDGASGDDDEDEGANGVSAEPAAIPVKKTRRRKRKRRSKDVASSPVAGTAAGDGPSLGTGNVEHDEGGADSAHAGPDGAASASPGTASRRRRRRRKSKAAQTAGAETERIEIVETPGEEP